VDETLAAPVLWVEEPHGSFARITAQCMRLMEYPMGQTRRDRGDCGESDAGKSVSALASVRLLPRERRDSATAIRFCGATCGGFEEESRIARRDVAMIFQERDVA